MTATAPTPDDAGLTLVEMLVAVAVLGITFVALLGGMATSIVTSDLHREQADALTLLSRAAESAKGAPYATCASSYPLPADAGEWSVAVVAVAWNGSSYATPPGTCPSADLGLQRVTVTVTSPSGRTTESVALVKRAP